MTGCPFEPVQIPKGLFTNFRRSDSKQMLWLWKIVDKVNSHGFKDSRVLVIETCHILLCRMNGNITRMARLADIEYVARQQLKGGLEQICIKFYAELGEPSLLLQLKADPRNPSDMADSFEIIDHFRSLARFGEPLTIHEIPSDVNMRKNSPVDLGTWKKCALEYKSPQDKWSNRGEYLCSGSVSPPAIS